MYDVLNMFSVSIVPTCNIYLFSGLLFSEKQKQLYFMHVPNSETWKTYIIANGWLYAAGDSCSPAGSKPLYWASQWEHQRKVSVIRLWHLQPDGSKTLSFCFSTFPHKAYCRRHTQLHGDLQQSLKLNEVSRGK